MTMNLKGYFLIVLMLSAIIGYGQEELEASV